MIDISSEVEFQYNRFGSILSVNEIDDITNSPMGYCTKLGNIYKVYHYNKFSNDYLNKLVLMHEYGHIYSGHLGLNNDITNKNLSSIISNNFDEISTLINNTCNINYGSDLLNKVMNDPYYNGLVHNCAADLEINSTILNLQDIRMLEEELNKLNTDKKRSKIKLIHPVDYGFPEGSTYYEYLVLVVKNLDKFINNLIELSSGNEGDSSDSSSDGKPVSLSDIDKLVKELSGESTDEKEKDSSKSNKVVGKNSSTDNNISLSTNIDPIDLYLEEIIRRYRKSKLKFSFNRDFTYKYNRRIDTSLISPKYLRRMTIDKDVSVLFVVDVSGSMASDVVNKCIVSISEGMRRILPGSKYSIVTWNTRKVQYFKDLNSRTDPPSLKIGGGTNLSKSFKFMRDNYSSGSIMIIISDFEDSLNDWVSQEEYMKGYYLYGLCYGSISKSKIDKFNRMKIFKIS